MIIHSTKSTGENVNISIYNTNFNSIKKVRAPKMFSNSLNFLDCFLIKQIWNHRATDDNTEGLLRGS